jgi:hypothetical protein
MAYFQLGIELQNGNIHRPDVGEIVEMLRDIADTLEANNSTSIQAIDGKGTVQAYCDVTDHCPGVLKQRRDRVEREKDIRAMFEQYTRENKKVIGIY